MDGQTCRSWSGSGLAGAWRTVSGALDCLTDENPVKLVCRHRAETLVLSIGVWIRSSLREQRIKLVAE